MHPIKTYIVHIVSCELSEEEIDDVDALDDDDGDDDDEEEDNSSVEEKAGSFIRDVSTTCSDVVTP